MIVVNSAAGLLAHAGDAAVDHRIAAAFTAAAVIGSLIAARLAPRMPVARLRLADPRGGRLRRRPHDRWRPGLSGPAGAARVPATS
ncbi:hypothetical protein [Actinoplanes lobatus]|uniref:Uncharacterized protein n=1 Tax=Actinoplanes lobatus TaxID=113568 RepID=A0A7W7HN35_9ACTN|nr:hypothetical protein [Actinoplanes lobatus]MBB4753564.1 hypothetical protein [Actinoplanes lobatus]